VDQTGENPGPFIAAMAKKLEKWGADFLVMPCNTAHYYYDQIQQAVSIPVVNLIDLVVESVVRMNPGVRVGILGSTAIIKTGLYNDKFRQKGIEPVYPSDPVQQDLFDLIKAIKAGHVGDISRKRFLRICEHLAQQEITLAIVACTELGIISRGVFPVDLVDAADLLAEKTVALAQD
jgi:aspartate racemase